MKKLRTAIIIAPRWHIPDVQNYRIARFIRWMREFGIQTKLICVGKDTLPKRQSWGQIIEVSDPINFYPLIDPKDNRLTNKRQPNRLRSEIAKLILCPDPGVIWAKSVAFDQRVLQASNDACFILSSSPRESSHIAASSLSMKCHVPHIMDMRDGWLDEPLKSHLRSNLLYRMREGRIERSISKNASLILLTSQEWKNKFLNRYREFSNKVHVITNCYPEINYPEVCTEQARSSDQLTVSHIGGFSSSHDLRSPKILLDYLYRDLKNSSRKGVIQFIGDLTEGDKSQIRSFFDQFQSIGLTIKMSGRVELDQSQRLMRASCCNIIYSASHAAIPSKLFDCLKSRRPIAYLAPEGSSVDRILKKIPQSFRLGHQNFYEKLQMASSCLPSVPIEFTEEYVSKLFIKHISDFV